MIESLTSMAFIICAILLTAGFLLSSVKVLRQFIRKLWKFSGTAADMISRRKLDIR